MVDGKIVRDCGECVACCINLRIDEINKARKTACPHLNGKYDGKSHTSPCGTQNCMIYKDRPKTCAEYNCAWLNGLGEESDRPDKIDIIIDNHQNIENALIAKPLKPGAENTEEGKAFIERVSRESGKPVIVIDFTEVKINRLVGRGLE